MLEIHGIHLAAFLTSGMAVAVFGAAIHKLRLPANERLLWLAAVTALPLQPLAFFWGRAPLDRWQATHLGASSSAYVWLTTLYAPLTEEVAKLVPLLIPVIVRDIRRETFVRYALAIGVGFAIGEIWFVADRIARIPDLATLPFYQFGGYMLERLMTCVFHSAFVSVALWRLRRRFALGFVGAVALHWLGNFPLFLREWNFGNLGKDNWMVVVVCFLQLYFIAAVVLLYAFAFGRVTPMRIFYGPRHCPECAGEYEAPLFALNFGRIRYERFPHCRRWHWTNPGAG